MSFAQALEPSGFLLTSWPIYLPGRLQHSDNVIAWRRSASPMLSYYRDLPARHGYAIRGSATINTIQQSELGRSDVDSGHTPLDPSVRR